jgi:transcriptional accessory protein Tex/SPT6
LVHVADSAWGCLVVIFALADDKINDPLVLAGGRVFTTRGKVVHMDLRRLKVPAHGRESNRKRKKATRSGERKRERELRHDRSVPRHTTTASMALSPPPRGWGDPDCLPLALNTLSSLRPLNPLPETDPLWMH